ncbi:MAG: TPM domain-containing protein, partial [Cyclobacteriaceae bacterium]
MVIHVLMLITLGAVDAYANSRNSVFDETGLLTATEKEQVEVALRQLQISHIHLADDFDGQRPHDFARKIYNEVLFFELPPERNDLVIVYSVADNVFEIYSGTKWTHILEEDEKQLIINELLIPAFANGRYAEGLL